MLEIVQLARQNTTRRVQGEYQYVIIGAGTTAYAAIETIFNHNPDADILIISSEGVSWLEGSPPSLRPTNTTITSLRIILILLIITTIPLL